MINFRGISHFFFFFAKYWFLNRKYNWYNSSTRQISLGLIQVPHATQLNQLLSFNFSFRLLVLILVLVLPDWKRAKGISTSSVRTANPCWLAELYFGPERVLKMNLKKLVNGQRKLVNKVVINEKSNVKWKF